MTSTDRNDLMPSQEKLEWVTPKICSLLGAGRTAGKFNNDDENCGEDNTPCPNTGPS
jgi:hypothetical protein